MALNIYPQRLRQVSDDSECKNIFVNYLKLVTGLLYLCGIFILV